MTNNINNLSFEEGLIELEKVTNSSENNADNLDKIIKNYEYGTQLIKHCEKKLQDAKLKVQKIMENEAELSDFN